MKLLQFNEQPKSPSSKKEVAKDVKWMVGFKIAGVKGVIVEAATHEIFEDTLYFYKSGEKVACAFFNAVDIMGVFKEGCVKKMR